MRIDQVAVQMYTLRQAAAEDLDATLWRLADIGYKLVEFAGTYGNAPEDVAAMLERHGLRAPAAHIPYQRFDEEWDGVVAEATTIGYEWVIVPALPKREIDENLAAEYIGKLNEFGRRAADAGLKFAYHNHAFEFDNVYGDDTTFYDRLIAGTDPDAVKLELDAFWVNRGGVDPARMLRDHGDRVRLVHIKDAQRGDAAVDVPFGEGALDWKAILDASDKAGVEYYVVEQDNPGDAFEDVTVALRNAGKWSQG
jgi:sugar phosphate isomerase/epimerase